MHDKAIESAETIPAWWYADPAFLERENVSIFLKSWQYLMPSKSVADSGQYAPAAIGALPLVVVRDTVGKLRCFHNVCRHRAGPIAVKEGKGRVLQCQYHGWSYGLDGRLIGTPRCEGMRNFDKSLHGLPEVAVFEWAGMVFVNPSAAAGGVEAQSFIRTLDGIAGKCGSQAPVGFEYYGRQTFQVQCNWKTYVDNYLEGYHVPMVHPGLARVLDTSNYTTTVFDDYTLQHSPLTASQNIYEAGEAFYFHLFPNMMFNILPGRMQTNVVRARGVHACEVVFDYFYQDVTSAEAKSRIESDFKFSLEVQQEDIDICEKVQIGLNSGSYVKGRYSPQEEAALFSFHEFMRRKFASA